MEQLQKYMLTNTFFDTFEEKKRFSKYHNNTSRVRQVKSEEQIENYYDIQDDDKFFWLFHIIEHGYDEYQRIKRGFSQEKQLKFLYIEMIKKHKGTLKKHKIKAANMIEDLGTSHTIGVQTFIGLCCIHNKNVCLIKNKICSTHTFCNSSSHHYTLDIVKMTLNKDTRDSSYLENTYILVNNLDKPLKSLSSYRKPELIEFASKVGLQITYKDTGKQKTKQVLYQEILENI